MRTEQPAPSSKFPQTKARGNQRNAIGRLKNEVDQSGKNTTEGNHLPSMNSYKLARFKGTDCMGSTVKMKKSHHRIFITTGRSDKAKAFKES